MMNIVQKVAIKAPASKVYAALATIDGLAGWWTKDTAQFQSRPADNDNACLSD